MFVRHFYGLKNLFDSSLYTSIINIFSNRISFHAIYNSKIKCLLKKCRLVFVGNRFEPPKKKLIDCGKFSCAAGN